MPAQTANGLERNVNGFCQWCTLTGFTHMKPDQDLASSPFKQRPVAPTLEASPVAFQCIRKTNSFSTVDDEADDVGTRKLCLVSGGFVGVLKGQLECWLSVTGLRWLLYLVTLIYRIRLNCLNGLFSVGKIGALKCIHLPLAL